LRKLLTTDFATAMLALNRNRAMSMVVSPQKLRRSRFLWAAVSVSIGFGAWGVFSITQGVGATSTPTLAGNSIDQVSCPSGDLIARSEGVFGVMSGESVGEADPAAAVRVFLQGAYPGLEPTTFVAESIASYETRSILVREGETRMVLTVEKLDGSWVVSGFVACNTVLEEGRQ
jgi:hypothetical protein